MKAGRTGRGGGAGRREQGGQDTTSNTQINKQEPASQPVSQPPTYPPTHLSSSRSRRSRSLCRCLSSRRGRLLRFNSRSSSSSSISSSSMFLYGEGSGGGAGRGGQAGAWSCKGKEEGRAVGAGRAAGVHCQGRPGRGLHARVHAWLHMHRRKLYWGMTRRCPAHSLPSATTC